MSIRRDERMKNAIGEPAYIIDYRDEYGRRKQTRTDACTLKDAQRIERAILTEIDKAKALGISKQALTPLTFSEFAEREYFPQIKKEIRDSSYSRYWDLYQHLKDYFGGMRLTAITAPSVRTYLERQRDAKTRRGIAPGGREINARRATLCAIIQKALEMDLVSANPVRAVRPAKVKRQKRHVLTVDDERRLMNAAPSWLKSIMAIGLYGGMREGEICSMKWGDVKGREFVYIPDSKTGADRWVPVNAEIQAALDAQPRHVEGGKAIPYVFWDQKRQRHFPPNRVSQAFSALARELGIPATFHSTRATFITRARLAGVKDAELMTIVGHGSLDMTNHYTNVAPEHLKGKTDVLCREGAETAQNAGAEKQAAI